MGAGHPVGVLDAGDVDDGAHDVGERGPGLGEGVLDDPQGRGCLLVGVPRVVRRLGAGAGDVDLVADPDGARVPVGRGEFSRRGDVLALHRLLLLRFNADNRQKGLNMGNYVYVPTGGEPRLPTLELDPAAEYDAGAPCAWVLPVKVG